MPRKRKRSLKLKVKGSPSPSRDWAHLPLLAVQLLSQKVKSIADYVRFRAVCSPWRSASLPKPRHLPPQLPWLMLPWSSRDTIDDGIRLFYDLWESKMRKLHLPETIGMVCCTSDRGWLLLVATEGKEVFLLNPLTRARIQLPLLATPVKHLGDRWDDPHYDHCWFDPDLGIFSIRKVTFSADPTNPDCLITVFPQRCRGFFCCRVREPSWTMVNSRPDPSEKYTDATYYDGRFYLLYKDAMEIIDSNQPEERIVHLLEPELAAVSKFLIEGKSGVYIVVPVDEISEFLLDGDDPAAHDTKVDTETCPKQKIELYQFQGQPLKLNKVADTGSTIIFCCSDSCPYLAVCSDDWGSLDGGSMYMELMSLSLEGESCCSIYMAKMDVGKLKSVVSGIGKVPRNCPSARAMWFQPSFF